MKRNKSMSEAVVLEQYRVALDNAQNQPEIAALMDELGFNAKVIDEGKKLWDKTRQAYDFNKIENTESTAAYASFDSKREILEDIYLLDRKKGKVVFRNNEVALTQLGLKGRLPKAYVKWIESLKIFYHGIEQSKAIQEKVARLKITPESVQAALLAITELNNERSLYLREVGESQEATNTKDEAFVQMDDWMSEFYAVAKIALDDKPQLLESLAKIVRN